MDFLNVAERPSMSLWTPTSDNGSIGTDHRTFAGIVIEETEAEG